MTRWRQWVATGMVVGMLHLTAPDVAQAGEPIALQNPTVVKQQVDLFGVGAKVKVRLVDGQKLAETIRGIENSTFLMASNKTSQTPVAYEHVAQLKCSAHPGPCSPTERGEINERREGNYAVRDSQCLGDRLVITMEVGGKPRFWATPGQPRKEEGRSQAQADPQQHEADNQRTGVEFLKGELQRLKDLLKGVEKERELADRLQDEEVRANVTEALDSAMDELQSAVRTIERQLRFPKL